MGHDVAAGAKRCARASVSLGVVLALLLAAGCGKTSPAATGGLTKAIWVSGLQNTPVPTATHGRVLALAVARSLLGALRVPSDAILPGSPPRSSPIRSAPPTSSSPNLVDLHRIWRVRGSVREVLAAVRRSHPVGMTVNGGGSAGEHAPREPEHEYWWYVTFRAPARTGLGSDQLAISMTAAPGGSTLLRVDGQVIWLSMRSAAERVPTAVSSIEVRRGSAGGARRLLGVISEPAAVQRIVAALERLPIVQPGTWVCPSESANPTVVHLTFRDSARKVLAEALQAAGAEVGNCDPMYFSVQGREQKPLAEGASAIAIVSQILGVRLLAG